MAVVVLIAAAFVELALYYPLIGATAASHFDIGGAPNAHQTKAMFFASWIFAILPPGIVALGVPSMLGHIPVTLINLPNKSIGSRHSDERKRSTASRSISRGSARQVSRWSSR